MVKLVRIPLADVLQDCQDGKPTVKFNTCFHLSDEPNYKVPAHQPTEAPYTFTRWLPLILRSRGLDRTKHLQTITLNRSQATLLVEAAQVSIITRRISHLFAEDLDSDIRTLFDSSLRHPPEGLFMRLDAHSPKDGQGHPLPLRNADDVILRLVTSTRARNAIRRGLQEEEEGKKINLIFLPFNPRMGSRHEYRVFCAPSSPSSSSPPRGKGVGGPPKITAVSQYQWHKPWVFCPKKKEEEEEEEEGQGVEEEEKRMKRKAEEIMRGVEGVWRMIVDELDVDGREEDGILVRQGFSFDVFYDDEDNDGDDGEEGTTQKEGGKKGKFELVELNVFGADSGCGSCLFQWVEDYDLMYGVGERGLGSEREEEKEEEEREVEFRVTW